MSATTTNVRCRAYGSGEWQCVRLFEVVTPLNSFGDSPLVQAKTSCDIRCR